jgi:hypothetical protein
MYQCCQPNSIGLTTGSGENLAWMCYFLVRRRSEPDQLRKDLGERIYKNSFYELAGKLFDSEVSSKDFPEFLTLAAYEILPKIGFSLE